MSVWIIKADGTLQCGLGKEISLETMKKELERLGPKVLDMEKRHDGNFRPQVCGHPTGNVNAYKISRDDWYLLKNGIVGPNGFRLDTRDHVEEFEEPKTISGGEPLPWPWAVAAPIAEMTSVSANPVLVRDLIGRNCRVYTTGDALTKDFRPSRVNIELNERQVIVDIWFG